MINQFVMQYNIEAKADWKYQFHPKISEARLKFGENGAKSMKSDQKH